MTEPALRLYVRVSTNQQELDGQLRQLNEAASRFNMPVVVYPEKVSGTGKVPRQQYDKLFRDVVPGDTILVWSLDRFSRERRYTDAVHRIVTMEDKGVRVMSLQ